LAQASQTSRAVEKIEAEDYSLLVAAG